MEFIDGYNLKELNETMINRSLKETTIKGFIVQLVEALSYLLNKKN